MNDAAVMKILVDLYAYLSVCVELLVHSIYIYIYIWCGICIFHIYVC
jgi:hypothetical protein